MTLCTVNRHGRPQAASVEYVVMDDFTLIFDTFVTYRKYENLQSNPSVACVITEGNRTVQCEGKGEELTGEALETCKTLFFAGLKRGRKFDQRPETRYFKITPQWLRYSDYGQNPWKQVEWTF